MKPPVLYAVRLKNDQKYKYIKAMSPTVFRDADYRFYFFSREEQRIHIHVQSNNGEAKFWMEPEIQIAQNHGLSMRELNEAHRLIKEHENEIREAWQQHFPC